MRLIHEYHWWQADGCAGSQAYGWWVQTPSESVGAFICHFDSLPSQIAWPNAPINMSAESALKQIYLPFFSRVEYARLTASVLAESCGLTSIQFASSGILLTTPHDQNDIRLIDHVYEMAGRMSGSR